MPDGSTWGVHLDVIAFHRAQAYQHEFGDDLQRSLNEDTLPLFASDSDEVGHWAANNMDWEFVARHARQLYPATVDYDDGWVNGEKRVLDIPDPEKACRICCRGIHPMGTDELCGRCQDTEALATLKRENQALRQDVVRLASLQGLLLPFKPELEARHRQRIDQPLPCPFCEGPALGIKGVGKDESFFACDANEQGLDCSVAPSTDATSREEALADWNKRPFEDRMSALMLRMIQLLQASRASEVISHG